MKLKIQVTIRVLLTLVLVCLVYTETGIWTAISLGLIFAALEMNGILIDRLRKEVEVDDLFSKILRKDN